MLEVNKHALQQPIWVNMDAGPSCQFVRETLLKLRDLEFTTFEPVHRVERRFDRSLITEPRPHDLAVSGEVDTVDLCPTANSITHVAGENSTPINDQPAESGNHDLRGAHSSTLIGFTAAEDTGGVA
jgi:hypothetical protein